MKTKLLTVALTAAGMAAVAVAQAQPAPAPPPTPAPTATTDPNAPPPAPPPGTPAPAPSGTTTAPTAPPPGAVPQDPNAPPPPPPVAPPAQQPPPATWLPPPVPPPLPPQQFQPTVQPAPAEEKPKGMSLLDRFAGSLIFWTNSASASIFGLATADNYVDGYTGRINKDADVYTQQFTFRPAFFLYREGRHAVRLLTTVVVGTEFTDCDSCTYRNQPDFILPIPVTLNDTISLASWGQAEGSGSNAAAARDPTLAGAAEYRTWVIPSGQLIFPAPRSQANAGMYMGTQLALGVRQQIKLFGTASSYLSNITVTLSEAWTHQFWRANVPVNDNINVNRVDGQYRPIDSDQLRGAGNVENRLAHTLSFFMPIYGDLQMNGSFQVINDFPHSLSDSSCDITITTGCVDLPASQTKMRTVTNFDMSLYYQITAELALDVGYNNFNPQLGENGQHRNPFFSPSSLFYADLYLFPQAFIDRLTKPKQPTNVGRR